MAEKIAVGTRFRTAEGKVFFVEHVIIKVGSKVSHGPVVTLHLMDEFSLQHIQADLNQLDDEYRHGHIEILKAVVA